VFVVTWFDSWSEYHESEPMKNEDANYYKFKRELAGNWGVSVREVHF
jgi:CDP-glycerol glycerophosphotransferase (TagB/SpsB family)